MNQSNSRKKWGRDPGVYFVLIFYSKPIMIVLSIWELTQIFGPGMAVFAKLLLHKTLASPTFNFGLVKSCLVMNARNEYVRHG